MDDLAVRLVDAVRSDFPGHVEGTRPAHARGIGAQGYFRPTDTAGRNYCMAEHFTSPQVPVTVRFSNGTGLRSVPDIEPDVRAMAVKFHLSNGRQTDLIAITLPVFPARTVEDFLELCVAAEPMPVGQRSRWRTLLDLLALRQPPPAPALGQVVSAAPGLFRFAQLHPFAEAGLMAMQNAITPISYAQTAYHAVHAFLITAPDGTVRAVRFHWDPVAGVRPVTEADLPLPDDYLQRDLGDRLDRGVVEFVLRVQIGETGDDTSDPTKAWPWRRRLIEMGRVYLCALVEDQTKDCERLSFNPTRFVDGIAGSDDQILAARGLAYQASCQRRGGSGCPVVG